ncbi:hypothetical protein [Aquimarina algiphila]|uniref:HNH domain-containing protein n=1 Tax=Aquimarina algiphila TaxID=2047982 RepID=A0A554VFD0_9FLAO|nr:hypothetical protein [Aquimarina algiphila]TSE05870.1 hypothetical protein FOF46_21365 [Aquimarina algiphila]
MIYLDPYSPHILKAKKVHQEKSFTLIKKRVNKLSTCELKGFLDDLRINKILTDLPINLEKHHMDLFEALPDYSIEDWNRYVLLKQIKNKDRTQGQKEIVNKYNNLTIIVGKIFKYKGGFDRKRSTYSAYDLAQALCVQTCTYCNRLYTKTVKNPNKTIRPEFDHWFPKENYPILALSFYNLIPSCHVCNSSVKGTTIMNLDDFLHPYVDDNIDYKFSYWIKKYGRYNFSIKRIKDSKEDNTIKAFKLEEIYKTHRDEIHDLVRIKKLYSISYLLKLKKMLNKTGQKTSIEELYRLAFGVHYNESNFHKRPLSKMKKDIIEELKMKLDE